MSLWHLQMFTKFCPNIFRMKMTAQVVEQSIRRSMAALRVPKLDLVQMHWWDYDMPGMVDVAKSLADLREKGLITSIGVTNMSTDALAQISDAGVPVVCNQVLPAPNLKSGLPLKNTSYTIVFMCTEIVPCYVHSTY